MTVLEQKASDSISSLERAFKHEKNTIVRETEREIKKLELKSKTLLYQLFIRKKLLTQIEETTRNFAIQVETINLQYTEKITSIKNNFILRSTKLTTDFQQKINYLNYQLNKKIMDADDFKVTI